MKYWLFSLLVTTILGVLIWLVFFGGWRTMQTVYLIARISPFERVIEGAPTILVIGDSTAYGTGVRRSEESLAGLIAADWPDYSVRTRAGNGWNSAVVRQRLPELVTENEQYAAVVVQIGANDIIQDRPLTESQADVRIIFKTLQHYTDHIVWLHSGDIGGALRFSGSQADVLSERTWRFRAMAQELAKDYGVTYVDLWRDAADDPIRLHPDRYIAIDGLHLTAAGYAHWYEKVRTALQTQLPLEQE